MIHVPTTIHVPTRGGPLDILGMVRGNFPCRNFFKFRLHCRTSFLRCSNCRNFSIYFCIFHVFVGMFSFPKYLHELFFQILFFACINFACSLVIINAACITALLTTCS